MNGHINGREEEPEVVRVSHDFRCESVLMICIHLPKRYASLADTMTVPNHGMFEAMRKATLGDDVYGEDATTNQFQSKVAELTGKEAGLFCTSGTMVGVYEPVLAS